MENPPFYFAAVVAADPHEIGRVGYLEISGRIGKISTRLTAANTYLPATATDVGSPLTGTTPAGSGFWDR